MDEHNKTVREAANTYQARPEPEPASIELRFPHAVKTYTELKSEKNEPFEWLKFSIGLITAAAVIAYTILAGYQLIQMKKSEDDAYQAVGEARRANDDAAKRFRQDQRPYVWLNTEGFGHPTLYSAPGPLAGKILWTFYYTNFGKSPAIDVRADVHVAFGDDAEKEVRLREITDKSRTILPPQYPSFGTASTDEKIDDATFSKIMDEHLPLIIFGHFAYRDMDTSPEITYITEFCMMRAGSSTRTQTIVYPCPSGHNHIR